MPTVNLITKFFQSKYGMLLNIGLLSLRRYAAKVQAQAAVCSNVQCSKYKVVKTDFEQKILIKEIIKYYGKASYTRRRIARGNFARR